MGSGGSVVRNGGAGAPAVRSEWVDAVYGPEHQPRHSGPSPRSQEPELMLSAQRPVEPPFRSVPLGWVRIGGTGGSGPAQSLATSRTPRRPARQSGQRGHRSGTRRTLSCLPPTPTCLGVHGVLAVQPLRSLLACMASWRFNPSGPLSALARHVRMSGGLIRRRCLPISARQAECSTSFICAARWNRPGTSAPDHPLGGGSSKTASTVSPHPTPCWVRPSNTTRSGSVEPPRRHARQEGREG
jgi:hypothetical protein